MTRKGYRFSLIALFYTLVVIICSTAHTASTAKDTLALFLPLELENYR